LYIVAQEQGTFAGHYAKKSTKVKPLGDKESGAIREVATETPAARLHTMGAVRDAQITAESVSELLHGRSVAQN
jgi:hypothetical protein